MAETLVNVGPHSTGSVEADDLSIDPSHKERPISKSGAGQHGVWFNFMRMLEPFDLGFLSCIDLRLSANLFSTEADLIDQTNNNGTQQTPKKGM